MTMPAYDPSDARRPRRERTGEQLTAALLDAAGVSRCTLDVAGTVVATNQAWLDLLDYDRHDVIGHSFAQFLSPEDAVAFEAVRTSARPAEMVVELPLRLLAADGSPRPVLFTGQLIADVGADGGLDCLLVDIAKQEALAEAYQTLVDQSLQGIVVLNEDGILLANEPVSKMTGYTVEELSALSLKQIRGLVHPEDREHIWRIVLARLRGEKLPHRTEVRFLRKNGSVGHVIARPARIHVDGKPAVQVAYEDVTAQKKTQEKVRRLTTRLRRLSVKTTAKEDADRRRLSRELHNSVGQQLANLGIVLTQLEDELPPDAEVARRQVTDLQSLAQEIGEHVYGIMSELRPSVLDDYGLGEALRWHAERFARRTGIRVHVDVSDLDRRMDPDVESALYRIAQEALTNAAKHGRPSRIELSLSEGDRSVVLILDDNGVGFEPEQQEKPGTEGGWGLSSMSEWAIAIGATLTIDTAPDRGTRIIAEVPLQ